MQSDGDVPKNLCAVSQIGTITSRDSLKKDEDFKITNCKHSTACTAAKQAADAAPNFKIVKSIVKSINTPHQDSNYILHILDDILI